MTLSTDERISAAQRVASESKSIRTAYLLWLVLGVFGAHRLYLERVETGVLMLMLALLGLLTLPIGVGVKFLTVSVLWMLVDGLLVPRMVTRQHESVRRRLIAEAAEHGA